MMTDRRALIIEDDTDFAAAVGDTLDLLGWDAEIVATGTEGIRSFERAPFDVVFIDLKLPDMTGFECQARLRQLAGKSALIPMTAFRIEHLLAQAADAERVEVLLALPTHAECQEMINGAGRAVVLQKRIGPGSVNEVIACASSHGVSFQVMRSEEDTQARQWTTKCCDLLIIDAPPPLVRSIELLTLLKSVYLPPVVLIFCDVSPLDLTEDPYTDPLASPEATGCLFKPFKPVELEQCLRGWGQVPKPS